MSDALNNQQLEKALTAIIDHMVKQKLIPESMGATLKKEVSTIAKDISTLELTHENLQNKNIQKNVMGMLASKALGDKQSYTHFLSGLTANALLANDPKLKNDPKFKLNTDINNKKLDESLKLSLMLNIAIAKTLKELNENKIKPEEFDNKLKMNLKLELKNFGDKLKLPNDHALRSKAENKANNISLTLNNNSDEITFTFGNVKGAPNFTIPDPNSHSFMTEANTFNTDKDDPLGLESDILQNDLSTGINSALEAVEHEFISPFSMKPRNPGEITPK